MKKLLLGTVAAMTVTITPALAADIAARRPVPVTKAPVAAPAPYFSWTGCYIGAQGGYSWADAGYDLDIPPIPGSGHDFDANGGVAGGHIGCNLQVNQWWVFGIEGDLEWNGLSGDNGGLGGTIDQIEAGWGASVRGRLGFTVGRTLFYGTGGIAWLDIDYSRPNFDPQVINQTLTGWTVGGGIEHAFVGNWTGRIEYRFSRFDSEGFAFTNDPRTLRDLDVSTLRVGLTYKFGGR